LGDPFKTPKFSLINLISNITMGVPNWGLLVAKDRAKAVGIPWNKEEIKAIHTFKIPASYVREGILTLEDYEKAIGSETEKPLFTKTVEEIKEEAKEVGVESTPDAPKDALVNEITKKKKLIKK
jgi:hypothetical protein